MLLQEVDGESVLLKLSSEKYFGLNPVGTRFIGLIRESGDVESAVSTILNEFDVGLSVLEADLGELVQALLANELIEIKE